MRHARSAAAALVMASAAGLVACGEKTSADPGARSAAAQGAPASAAKPVPRLVDLGAGKCIPCKAMAPILEQLRVDYAGRLEVTFIDVWQKPDEARTYGIGMIPTQIFYAADGRELARHQGFIARDEDHMVRVAAAGALEHVGTKPSWDALRDALLDRSVIVQEVAEKSLRCITEALGAMPGGLETETALS